MKIKNWEKFNENNQYKRYGVYIIGAYQEEHDNFCIYLGNAFNEVEVFFEIDPVQNTCEISDYSSLENERYYGDIYKFFKEYPKFTKLFMDELKILSDDVEIDNDWDNILSKVYNELNNNDVKTIIDSEDLGLL